jgi:hypothetical protein
LNAERFRRLKEEQREFINDANLDHALEISRQRAGDRSSTSSTLIATMTRFPTSKRDAPRTRLLAKGWQRGHNTAGKLLRR